jgi:hypothetical protein
MEYEPMVGTWYEVLGDVLDKSAFGFEWGFAVVGKSNAVGYTKYMSIYCHSWLSEADCCDDVGCFSTYTRQGS